MGTKTYVFWCIIWPLTAFTVGTMAGDFVMGEGIFTTRVGNAFCAGTAMTFVAFAIVEVSVRILDKIDSKRNKNDEDGEDKN